MKCRVIIFLFLCGALIISSCAQKQPLSPESQEFSQNESGLLPDEELNSFSKVVQQEFIFPIDLDEEDPFVICNGELMQYHGIVDLHITETTTPSGNMIVRYWVDYNAHGAVTIEGSSSGNIWTLTNGHNPFGEVIKENGFYLIYYQWHEFFTNPVLGKLRVQLKGHVKVEPDGTVKIERESVRCF